jgi:heme/copper-type cytochrome/quinol oxidase subunit 3
MFTNGATPVILLFHGYASWSETENVLQRDNQLLPISTNQFGWWLLLSAQMMMFAGVIGSSCVLRSGVPAERWPEPSWVKSHWCIAMVTIVLLTLICWFLTRAKQHPAVDAQGNAVGLPWKAFALACAAMNLCVVGLDLQSKTSLGLVPSRDRAMVYDRADLSYLSAVSAAANDRVAVLETNQTSEAEPTSARQLERWKVVRDGLITWTRQTVGRSDDPMMRELSLAGMADQIYRTNPDPRLAKFADDEAADAENRLQTAEAELEAMGKDEETQKQILTQEINWLRQRLSYLDSISDEDNPVQELMKQYLPKVISGGPTWISNYWLLTGFLFLQLLVGSCLLAAVSIRREDFDDSKKMISLQNVTAYWYFVAATGIIVSVLVWIV